MMTYALTLRDAINEAFAGDDRIFVTHAGVYAEMSVDEALEGVALDGDDARYVVFRSAVYSIGDYGALDEKPVVVAVNRAGWADLQTPT